jgi:cell division protein FtsQ
MRKKAHTPRSIVEPGDSHDPGSGVANQGRTQSRPLIWEDEASGESRFRRVQTGVPPNKRSLPGMPLEMNDPDDEDAPRLGGNRFGKRFNDPPRPWWRPASVVGRVFLGLGVLTVLGSVTAGAMTLKAFLGRDSRFRIAGTGNIEATGLTEVSRSEMLPVFGEDIGKNIFFIHLDDRRKQLEQIPWVEHATVMRILPDQIRVNIVERQPVAFVRQGQQVGLVDKEGVLLTMPAAMMAQHHYSFPVVTGIEPSQPVSMRKARMAVYQRLLSELDANNQHLSEQISEIDLTDPQDARILLPEQGGDILGHFGEDRFLDRYQRYKAHIAEWRQQYPKLAAVDLRYDSQVVLEMTPGTTAVAETIGAAGGVSPAKSASDAAGGQIASAKPPASKRAPVAQKQPDQAAKRVEAKPVNVAVKQTPPPRPKASAKKETYAEILAAKQRQDRERAREKAAREKSDRDKKHALPQKAALIQSRQKPSPFTRQASAGTEGQ